MTIAWAAGFAYLSVVRDLAGGSHAEDLGFTDQVLWNFLHGQWFRMSIYLGGTWDTELDLSRVARPDSLLAFHVEPMLLGLLPIYALGGMTALLVLQAASVAAGAIPAYRLTRHLTSSGTAAVAVVAAYLMSPFGQWTVLSDFHTSALAVPLLLLSLERLFVGRSTLQAFAAAAIAVTAREDVAPVVAMLGFALLITPRTRRAGAAALALGVGWSLVAALVLRTYSGGISPFEVRYGPVLGGGASAIGAALSRPAVLDYLATILLSGGWLGLLSPLALLPALPSFALNVLSTSPWMAAGKAHYSGLILSFIVVGAALGLRRLTVRPRLQLCASLALVGASALAYVLQGSGPLAANYAPATVTSHALDAEAIARSLPRDAAVSASTSLVPRLTQRPHVYVFPAVEDADYVFVDLQSTPAPTSAGDMYLRLQSMLASGDWHVRSAQDGLIVLNRDPAGSDAVRLGFTDRVVTSSATAHQAALVSAVLVPSPDGAIDVDGPHWILRTVWQTDQPLAAGTRLEFDLTFKSGETHHVWDIAGLWWNPPDQWRAGQPVTVDVPDVPVREFASWSASWSAQ